MEKIDQTFFAFLSCGGVIAFVCHDKTRPRIAGEAMHALHAERHEFRFQTSDAKDGVRVDIDFADGKQNFAIFYQEDGGFLLEVLVMIVAAAHVLDLSIGEPPHQLSAGDMVVLRQRRGEQHLVFECMTVPPEPEWVPPPELTEQELEGILSNY